MRHKTFYFACPNETLYTAINLIQLRNDREREKVRVRNRRNSLAGSLLHGVSGIIICTSYFKRDGYPQSSRYSIVILYKLKKTNPISVLRKKIRKLYFLLVRTE